jgi:hypothetical protein
LLRYPFDVGDEPINGLFAKRLISGSDGPFATIDGRQDGRISCSIPILND